MVKIEQKSHKEEMEVAEKPSNDKHYPYGTSIDLDGDLLSKLGIEGLNAEDQVNIKAVAFIKSKSVNDRSGSKKRTSMCLQFTELDVEPVKKDRAAQLYGDDD